MGHSLSPSDRVVIVGGGVIGLTSALELAGTGASITLVERGEIGRGCSEGNAGWVTPAISLPIAAPGLRTQGLLWFFKRDSPLYIRPSAIPALLPWLLSFWRHCSQASFDRGAAALMPFASDAVERYDELGAALDDAECHQMGLLMAFRTESARDDELGLLEHFGYGPVTPLDGRQLENLEPTLPAERFHGGIHVQPESHVEPLTVCRALARRLAALGAEIHEHTSVHDVVLKGDAGAQRAQAVTITRRAPSGSSPPGSASETIECDHLVIATGAEAGRLAARAGAKIPLQAGKGYSTTVSDPETRLEHPLYLAEAKVGISPFAGTLRVAGTLEMSGINTRLDRRRLNGFLRAAEHEIPGITRGSSRTEWVGMRPMTPDGLPVIGRCPGTRNVWLNTAQQMLGITLAPRSARLLTDIVLQNGQMTGDDEDFARAFSPSRF